MIRVTTEWAGTIVGGPYYTTMYFEGDTDGEADAAVAAVGAFWIALDPHIVSGAQSTVLTDVELVDPATGQITAVFSTPGAVNVFAGTGDALPWATQGLLRWRTGDFIGGREIRGRTFLPGMRETDSVGGVPTLVWSTAVQEAADDLLVAAAPAGGMSVYSPTHGQSSLVTNASPWGRWAVLRSRRD